MIFRRLITSQFAVHLRWSLPLNLLQAGLGLICPSADLETRNIHDLLLIRAHTCDLPTYVVFAEGHDPSSLRRACCVTAYPPASGSWHSMVPTVAFGIRRAW